MSAKNGVVPSNNSRGANNCATGDFEENCYFLTLNKYTQIECWISKRINTFKMILLQ